MTRVGRVSILAALSLAALGCATSSTASDYGRVRQLARGRAGMELPVDRIRAAGDGSAADVRALVRQPLTLASAERIALLNNRELRAELHSLGIARGQLLQASLLPNPELDAALKVPEGSGGKAEWEVGVGIDVTALILRGARSAVARAELDAARFRAASAVLDLGLRVRRAYYVVLAKQQNLELMGQALASFAGGYETARALHEAGNVTDLDLATERAAYEAAKVVVAEAEADLFDERERLNALLGLHGSETAWTIEQRLPDAPVSVPESGPLEARAIEASLALAEARATMTARGRQVGLSESTGWLPDLTVGVQGEHDGAVWSVGPTVSGTLPIFDRQQGAVLTSQAQLDQLRERYAAIAVEIRAAVRAVRNRAHSALERARHYREVLLPLRKQVLEQAMLQYNAMQIGVFQLLQARRDELDAARAYIEVLREYWTTRAELDQLLAGQRTGSLAADGELAASTALPARSRAAH